jgi:hypothetical protein
MRTTSRVTAVRRGLAAARAAISTSVRGVRIKANGARPAAVNEAKRVIKALVRYPLLARAAKRNKVEIVIIPKNRKLTDLPEFKYLKGKKTFDGRSWDDTRGLGGTRLPNGRYVIAASEENLANLPGDKYSGNFKVALHELAHTVQDRLIPKRIRSAIAQAYREQRKAGGEFSSRYARSTVHEYFATGVDAYFDSRESGNEKRGSAWMKQADPRLYRLMERLFGPPPAAAPTSNAA